MNIAICDDEQIYADEIKKHVECYFTRREVPHKIYVFTDGQAAARSEVKFDIAFLDIEIGSVSGLDVGKAMRKNNPNIVFIVVTAFSKYLDDALDLKVLRFLEKPINSERLYAGIDRAIDTLNDTTVGFYLRDGDMDYKKILLCDLIMIETDRRRTKVYTDAEVFRTKKTLSEWQRELTEPFFMVHDIKNHLGVIESIADNDKVTAYIGELCSNIGKYYAVSQLTGNKMLDIIIGKYTALCSKNGLDFNAKALTSNLSFVHDSDISAMVGNLLDNAFEAAKQAENGKIEFSLYTIDGKSCVVSVINTALTAPKCENETLVSAKPDAQSHGYGIKSIKKTAEKYGGSYSWFYDDKNREFHAMVILPIPSASC